MNDEESKMISSTREAKQEGEANDGGGGKLSKGPSSSSSSRQWSSFRNPRIVRVSRSSGGKDRHSKVCTVRGLRDRRIRLSVPTAIQLYDLQERLGVGQPSKVVDWLLEANKDDIDKLPPLQMPVGFNQFHQPLLVPHELNNPPFFDPNSMLMKDGEDEDQRIGGKRDKGKWIDHGNHGGNIEEHHQRVFPLTTHSPFPGFLNNGMPLNSYYHWDPPNLSLSRFGHHGLMVPQTENFFSGNTTSALLPSSSSSTVPTTTMASFFPTYPPDGNDSRQMNYLQFLSSNFLSSSVTMSSIKPFPLNTGLIHTQDDEHHGDDQNDTDC